MSNISPEIALLGFLVESPSHGYDLHQKFTTELGEVWRLSQSQAYAILKRLEMRGYITSHTSEQEKLPARQVLQITEAGRCRFEEWLEGSGRNARSIRLEFLTRLHFACKHQPEKVAHIFVLQWEKIQEEIERLEKLFAGIPPKQPYNRLSLDLRLRQMKLIRDWLTEIKTEFDIPDGSPE